MNQFSDTQRIAMVVEFDGQLFHGWQKQSNAITVQAVLESALAKIEGRPLATASSGRTDAGVHAEAMLVHADVSARHWKRSARTYTQGVNRYLPDGVVVVGVCAVESDFHARFSCQSRRYRYQIWNRSTPSALLTWRYWWMPRNLNIDAMQEAASYMLGKQDFSSLQGAGCQAHSASRDIGVLTIEKKGCEVLIEVEADGFLYHMVRNIVGNLVHVGIGHWQPEYIQELLALKKRSEGAVTAPSQGLYFVDAIYPNFSARDLIGRQSNE